MVAPLLLPWSFRGSLRPGSDSLVRQMICKHFLSCRPPFTVWLVPLHVQSLTFDTEADLSARGSRCRAPAPWLWSQPVRAGSALSGPRHPVGPRRVADFQLVGFLLRGQDEQCWVGEGGPGRPPQQRPCVCGPVQGWQVRRAGLLREDVHRHQIPEEQCHTQTPPRPPPPGRQALVKPTWARGRPGTALSAPPSGPQPWLGCCCVGAAARRAAWACSPCTGFPRTGAPPRGRAVSRKGSGLVAEEGPGPAGGRLPDSPALLVLSTWVS